jgi:hypothetical protein
MAKEGARAPAKGKNLTGGGGWKPEAAKGRKRRFSAKLPGSHNLGEGGSPSSASQRDFARGPVPNGHWCNFT